MPPSGNPFEVAELSRNKGSPVTLYFFRYGDTTESYYAYTDAEEDTVWTFDPGLGPVTFKPIPIDHGAISSSGTLDKSSLDVKTPQDSELSMLFRLHPPSQIVTLRLLQGHEGVDDFRVAWAGRVLGNQVTGNETTFTCEPVSTSIRRAGLRRHYQLGCPLALYGVGEGQCNADKEAASTFAAVSNVAGALVALGGAWAADEMRIKYTGGIAEWQDATGRTETRTIVRLADSQTLVLSGVALGLVPGASIKLSFGCDHTWAGDCTNLHHNVQNFGGDPLIPTKNPIGIVNNFQ